MTWNDNKMPVHFHKWQPYMSILGRRGWLFHHGTERVAISSYEMSRLLKEEKAYLVVDKDTWERLVARYRGKQRAAQPQISPEPARRAELQKRLRERESELARVMQECKDKWTAAQESLRGKRPEDAAHGAKLAREYSVLMQKRNALEAEIKKLKAQPELARAA